MEVILGLCALLITIGGVSDAIFKPSTKRYLAGRLLTFHQPHDQLMLSRIADRLLGDRLISWKSFRRSVAFSLTAVAVALLLAYWQDPVFFAPIAEKVLTPDTGIAALCVGTCLVFTAFADFLSIAQTRLFAKTIEKFSDWRITATMVAADVMMSLTLFLLLFSFARTLAYVFILLSAPSESITSRSLYSPRVLQVIATRAGIADDVMALTPAEYGSDPRLKHLRGILAADLSRPGSELVVVSLLREEELRGVARKDLFSYYAQWQCLNPSPSAAESLGDSLKVFSNTQKIFENGLTALVSARPKLRLQASPGQWAQASFAEVAKEQVSCPMPTIAVFKTFRPREALSAIGPLNAYMSALAGSTYGIFISLPNKFSGYEMINLNSEIGLFLANGARARSMPFFGMGKPNSGFQGTSEYFSALEIKTDGETAIPFTTFSLSSIFASLILFMSLIVGWSSRMGLRIILLTSVNVDQRKLSKLVFTFCGCAVSVLLVACAVGYWLLELLWIVLLT